MTQTAALSEKRTLFELGLVRRSWPGRHASLAKVLQLPSILSSATHTELLSRIETGAGITVSKGPTAVKSGGDAGASGAAALPMFVLTPGGGTARPYRGGRARPRGRAGTDQP